MSTTPDNRSLAEGAGNHAHEWLTLPDGPDPQMAQAWALLGILTMLFELADQS